MTVSLSRGVVSRGGYHFYSVRIEGNENQKPGRLRYVMAYSSHAWLHEEEDFYIRADGEEVPVEMTDDYDEVIWESLKDFPEDPEDYPEGITISMNGSNFRARSLLFENDVVFEQYKGLEEEAYGKGGDVLVLGGGVKKGRWRKKRGR